MKMNTINSEEIVLQLQKDLNTKNELYQENIQLTNRLKTIYRFISKYNGVRYSEKHNCVVVDDISKIRSEDVRNLVKIMLETDYYVLEKGDEINE